VGPIDRCSIGDQNVTRLCVTDWPMVLYNLFTRPFDRWFLNAMWFVCRTDWPMILHNLFTRSFDRWLCFIYEFFQPCPMDLRTGFGRLTDGTYSTDMLVFALSLCFGLHLKWMWKDRSCLDQGICRIGGRIWMERDVLFRHS